MTRAIRIGLEALCSLAWVWFIIRALELAQAAGWLG